MWVFSGHFKRLMFGSNKYLYVQTIFWAFHFRGQNNFLGNVPKCQNLMEFCQHYEQWKFSFEFNWWKWRVKIFAVNSYLRDLGGFVRLSVSNFQLIFEPHFFLQPQKHLFLSFSWSWSSSSLSWSWSSWLHLPNDGIPWQPLQTSFMDDQLKINHFWLSVTFYCE